MSPTHHDPAGPPRARVLIPALVAIVVALGAAPAAAPAQVERVYHPMYLPAQHNWVFRDRYPAMDRLFAAFDYGHGILYETLWTRPDAPPTLLEEEVYDHLTRDVLRNPPRMPMPEASFMPRYARLVPLAKEMFEWAHILHRQTYDVLADDRVTDKDAAMAELLDFYRSSRLAFSDVPKGMAIMDEQYFSRAFRERHPKFNGLIWAYHWLQVAVYEPLLLLDSPEERQAATAALLARFWQMLEDPPHGLPSEMPMTPAIAPEFTARYPRIAAVFDNLHMMHDVISDILVSDQVADKRAEIYRQADLFRDPAAMAVARDEWIAMALAHGLDAQGGPALGILTPAPTTGAEPHEHHHPPVDPHVHDADPHVHDADPPAEDDAEAHEHEAHEHPGHRPEPPEPDVHRHDPDAMARDPGMRRTMALVLRLLDDAHVQHRVHAVPELHEAWADAGVRRHLEMMRARHAAHAPDPAADDHQPRPDPAPAPPPAGDEAVMRRLHVFVTRLLDDPHVQQRIHAVPEYHEMWSDPAVQGHLEAMRARL